jgi:PAS domain S-box-containing protein
MNIQDKTKENLFIDQQEPSFSDIFNLADVQHLQDLFADAHGVASIITDTEGKPITKPSNFTRLCENIIRKTDKGCANCFKSDAVIGSHNPDGAIIQPCLSGGLWDAGASITVGGKHIGNWLIGQVRNEGVDEQWMMQYAGEIGANKEDYKAALDEVPFMSSAQFHKIADLLFVFANELSEKAYSNMQLSRHVAEKEKAIANLQEREERYRSLLLHFDAGIVVHAPDTSIVMNNARASELLGLSDDQLRGKAAIDPAWNFIDEKNIPLSLEDYPVTRIVSGKHPIKNQILGIIQSGKSDIVWVTVNGFPVLNTQGDITEIVISFIDITERRMAETRLVASEQKLKEAQHIAHMGNWELNIETH